LWVGCFFQVHGEPVELLLPEAAVAVDPSGRLAHRAREEAAPSPAALAATLEQAGALQHPQVFGDRWQGDSERLSELAHGRIAGPQPRQDGAPRRVREGGEGVAQDGFMVNHMVK
jgi:hypothetical protein